MCGQTHRTRGGQPRTFTRSSCRVMKQVSKSVSSLRKDINGIRSQSPCDMKEPALDLNQCRPHDASAVRQKKRKKEDQEYKKQAIAHKHIHGNPLYRSQDLCLIIADFFLCSQAKNTSNSCSLPLIYGLFSKLNVFTTHRVGRLPQTF